MFSQPLWGYVELKEEDPLRLNFNFDGLDEGLHSIWGSATFYGVTLR